jgi:hypothetical protein
MVGIVGMVAVHRESQNMGVLVPSCTGPLTGVFTVKVRVGEGGRSQHYSARHVYRPASATELYCTALQCLRSHSAFKVVKLPTV